MGFALAWEGNEKKPSRVDSLRVVMKNKSMTLPNGSQ
jgi:hypothetical protein